MKQAIAFLFSGQGSHSKGMGLDIVRETPIGRDLCERANHVLEWSFEELVVSDDDQFSLKRTLYAQPAIYTLSYMIYMILNDAGLKPALTAGHSAGEYAALTAAGAWNFETGLNVIAERARLMSQVKNAGTMAAVIGLDPHIIEEVCKNVNDGIVVVANYNSPKQTVISGEVEAIEKITPVLKEHKARRVLPLDVSGAFHSPLMKESQHSFNAFMQTIELQNPGIPWISNNTAEPVMEPETIREHLVRQFCEPVRWNQLMLHVERECEEAVESGPGNVLKGLTKACCDELSCLSTGTLEEIEKVKGHYGISS